MLRQGWESRAVIGLVELGGEEHCVSPPPPGAGCGCPTYLKSEPPCLTSAQALDVMRPAVIPAFGPWHTEASRNPAVWGITHSIV